MSLVISERVEGDLLTAEEERDWFGLLELAKKYGYEKDEGKIKDLIAKKFSLVVSKEVAKMRMYNIDRSELLAQGYYALAYSINGFDASKGFRFSSYASRCINLLLLTYIGQNYSMFNMYKSGKIKKIFFKVRQLVANKSHDSGSNYLNRELAESIAEELGVSVEDVEWVYGQFEKPRYDVQTDMVSGDSYSPDRGASLHFSDEPSPEEKCSDMEKQELFKELIGEAMKVLDDREREIYERRTLEKSGKNETLSAIGKDLGMTGEGIRQIKLSADEKIQKELRKLLRKKRIDIGDVLR